MASIAKPFLAAVVLRLMERDLLDLDAPIGSYLEELASAPIRGATLRQLLSHTSGLIDHSDAPDYFERARAGEWDRSSLVELARSAPLLFEPGSDFAYSNFGYSLLALTAERVTGATYPELLEREITSPLGLEHTTWNDVMLSVPGRAVGFLRAFDGSRSPQPLVDAVADLGSGDVLGTALDLWHFERAPQQRKAATTLDAARDVPQPGARSRRCARLWTGLGGLSHPYDRSEPRETQGHGGLSYGFVNVMERDPRSETFFAVLSNVRPSDDVLNNIPPPDIRRMQADLRRLSRGEEVEPPRRCLARMFLDRHDAIGYEAALQEVDQLRTESPEAFEFDTNAFMLGAYELKAHDQSIRLIEYCLEHDPGSWLLLEALGDFLAEAGRRQEALDAYRRAAAKNPDRQYLRDRIEALSRIPKE